jgi:preprotein translocase subunit SecA
MIDKAREIFAVLMDDYIGSKKDVREWEIEPFRQQLQYFFGYDPEKGRHRDPDEKRRGGQRDHLGSPRGEVRRQGRAGRRGTSCGNTSGTSFCRSSITRGKDHLLAMDHLKDGIGLRAYGQKDPLVEYKRESFDMFGMMREQIENDAVRFCSSSIP